MNTGLIIVLVGVASFIIGWGVNYFAVVSKKEFLLSEKEKERSLLERELEIFANEKEKTQEKIVLKEEEKQHILSELNGVKEQLARSTANNENLETKLLDFKADEDKKDKILLDKFENLSNNILKKSSGTIQDEHKRKLNDLLDPLKKDIEKFEKKLVDSDEKNIGKLGELKNQLQEIGKLNENLQKEARILSKALKGESKTRGNWGEDILERLLEYAGLKKDVHYTTQKATTTEEGNRLLPDVVIHLPDNKKMIIDSKVSLNAYLDYTSAESKEEKAIYLKDHIQSIKTHIKQLSDKEYDYHIEGNTPDFVIMFMPIESAFLRALESDATLWQYAYSRKIMLLSPGNLLVTLKIIRTIWLNEKQNKNAAEIAERAGRLYDKFVGFTSDLEKVGDQIGKTNKAYEQAMSKLNSGTGNLLTQVDKLKDLGAKTEKSLPKIP